MHKLAELCVRRPVFATMLIMSLVVVGAFSYFHLGVDLLPKVDVPTVAVVVSDPGASAEEIETDITKPVEDAVNTISQIDDIQSFSSEGLARVIITFSLDKNGDVATQEVQNKINQILPKLPSTAKTPVIQKFDPDAQPILQIAVSAPRPLRDLTDIADRLVRRQLENAQGVGEVDLVGGLRRQMRIEVDPERMRAFNLSVPQVALALRAQNLEMPGGHIDEGSRELNVRTMGRLISAAQFNDIAVARRGDYTVRIRDIGQAVDSQEEPRSVSRLDGRPAVTLVVLKQSGANTVDTADAVRQRLQTIAATLPGDVHTEIIGDTSVFIRDSVNAIKMHLIEGSFFAALVIFLFLTDLRSTLIAAVAIPTSIIAAFALMAAMGFTLNQITMLALTLMVGIVIDDAIIVLENIYRMMEERGLSPFQAAIEGTRDIGLAVMATTLSLLAVFLPIGFMGGIVGRFMSSFGFTSSFAIAVSLLVSFTLTPMLTARFIRPKAAGAGGHGSKDSRLFRFLDRHYTNMLEWSMAHRRLIVLFCLATILSSIPLFIFVGKNFLPTDDKAEFMVRLRAREGSSLAATTTVAERAAAEIRALPGVTDTLTQVGGGGDEAVNEATIYVILSPIHDRSLSQQELMLRARDLIHRDFPPELVSAVEPLSVAGDQGNNAQVQYVITGPDLNKLNQYSQHVLAQLKKLPDVVDTDTSLRSGQPELRVVIHRQRAADLGVQVQDIAQALNTLVGGETVSTFNADGEQYDVWLTAKRDARSSAGDLSQLVVASSKLGWVRLDQVASIEPGTGPSVITRLDRQRAVTLSANVLPGGSEAKVIQQLDQIVQNTHMDPGYGHLLTGLSKELGRTGYYFMLAFALTFIFIYIVLAAQFESFIHPITILLTLPLAIPFGIASLLIAGQAVNIFSGLGLLLLFGIVKKNAILQIDHTNTLRAEGMERGAAILQANRDRLRPILMTTLALVAGMIPLVVSNGSGAATNRSIGVLVIGGQTLCLLLTLLAVPVFYSLFEDAKLWPGWRKWARRLASVGPLRTATADQSATALASHTEEPL